MLWYRLDHEDRDWVSFLRHLIAAGREHDPAFAPTTAAMLGDLSVGGPTREAATDVFLRELGAITTNGAVLVLDDFHLVDDSPEIRAIVRELVKRGPERFSIVVASRRTPSIPLARLRATGEVVELGTDDLRFDANETARLFRETYGRTLDPDVLADVRGADRGLGGLTPTGGGRPAGPLALRDTPLRSQHERSRPGAVRLPGRGGRW